MSAIKLALTAIGLASRAIRNPAIRLGVRTVVTNPKLRQAALKGSKDAAYTAGRLMRKIVPRNLIG